MKKLYPIIILLLCYAFDSFGQDITFSQFYEMPMLRNPSLAGLYNGDIRVNLVHRSQWQSVTIPYQTSSLGVEYKLPVLGYNDFLTLGLQTSLDVAGDVKLKRTQLFPVINFHKSLSGDVDNYLSLAFMGGPVQSQFDPTQAKFDDQYVNGSYTSTNQSAQTFSRTGYAYLDASTGLTFSSAISDGFRYYIGAGLFHFNKPKINFYNNNSETNVQQKWVLNAGLTTETGDNARLVAFVDYFKQGGMRQFLGGFLYETDLIQYDDMDKISLSYGGFYRFNDALIPVVRLTYHACVVGVSYDVNVSKLKTASQLRGGFELTGSFTSFLNSSSSTKDKVLCPKF